jgi:gliding motility-associated-like protein
VLVSAMPISLFDYTPRVAQTNQIYTFTNLSSGGVSYQWNFGDSRVVFTSRTDTIIKHIFTASDTYNVCLYTTNSVGCVSTYCEPVTAEVNPLFDVPNAFTPNGDNVNDRIFVRGFGITKMTWRIYNRWGAVVFISTDIYEGWDGKVNGKLQPQEVYHYTVEVEFSDKVKATKKGDITLLR